ERERMKTMKIHEKTTYSTKIKAKPKELRKALQKEEEEARKQTTNEVKHKSIWVNLSSKAIKRDYPLVKETSRDYINNEREIFFLKYDMAVKQDEIQSLEDIIKEEERKLEMAENELEKEATMFDDFLKEDHKNTAQVLKIAEKETTAKTEKVTEIREITSQIEKLQSDITGLKNILQENKMYRDFLYQVSPKEWQEKHRKKTTNEKALRTASKADEKSASPPTTAEQGECQGRASHSPLGQPCALTVRLCVSRPGSPLSYHFSKGLTHKMLFFRSSLEDAENETSSDEDEDPELYFTDPQQLLSIFTEMEEENLSFIKDSQEAEERLAKVQHTFTTTHEKMPGCKAAEVPWFRDALFQTTPVLFWPREEQLAELKQQVATLKSCVTEEEERLADPKEKIQLFSSEEHKAMDEEHAETKASGDKMLTSLKEKVLEVYLHCTGENEANLQTIQMLMVIEKKLNDLLDTLERIPPAKIEKVAKAKRKERKTK
ncbi:CP100 protein, partial [Geococcyx californianus]|nr:CP100 protein [Geococcyx californianus]